MKEYVKPKPETVAFNEDVITTSSSDPEDCKVCDDVCKICENVCQVCQEEICVKVCVPENCLTDRG